MNKDLFLPITIKHLFFFLLFCCMSMTTQAQHFIGTEIPPQRSTILEKTLKEYQVFSLDAIALSKYVHAADYDDKIHLKLGNKDWEMVLYENDIRSENYQVRIITPNGIVEEPKGKNITFKGYLKNDASSEIRLTINGNFIHGIIQTKGKEYFIEPIQRYSKDYQLDHFLVYDTKNVLENPDVKCGVHDVMDFKEEQKTDLDETESVMMSCVETELAIFSDHLYYVDKGSTVGGVTTQTIAVMNAVTTDYDDAFTDEIQFKIVEQVVSICATCDPVSSTTNPSTLNSEFADWAYNGGFKNAYDLGQLWTDRDFDGSTIGLASRPGTCIGPFRHHVLQDYNASIEYQLRVLTSHEIGHNFNCQHVASGIMFGSVNNTTAWHATSVSTVNNYLTTISCLAACSAMTCDPVTALTVSNTNTNVTASWTGTAANYRVILYDENGVQIDSDSTSNNTLTLTPPLTLCNEYRVSVEAKCGVGDYSIPLISIFKTDFDTDFEIQSASVVNCSSGIYDLEVVLTHGGGNGSGFNVTADGTTQAFTFGTSPQTVTVTGLTANADPSTPVSVSAVSNGGGDCDASTTYLEPNSSCAGVIFKETFDNCVLPTTGWTNETDNIYNFGSENFIFKFDWDNHSHFNYPSTGDFDGSCFVFMDDDINSNVLFTGIVTLTSPVIDLTNYDGITLNFDYNFHNFETRKGVANDSQFDVEVYDGTSWVNILTDDTDVCSWLTVWDASCITAASINVNAYKNANFQIRFLYTDGSSGQYTGMVGFDNVEIDATTYLGGCTQVNYYPDNDGDSYGAGSPTLYCPGDEPAGYVSNNDDCDDNNNMDVNITVSNSGGPPPSIPDATYLANSTITSAGLVPSTSTQTVFKAGEEIVLNPDLWIKEGANFTAKIESCAPMSSPLVSAEAEEVEVVSTKTKLIEVEKKTTPELFIFPNPTSNTTNIQFDLTENTLISLFVFDARGDRVNTLLENEMMMEGTNHISFDTNNIPVGVYSVLLQMENKNVVKRLVVIKDN